ncbi:MAG: glycosyltransferase [Candidatus Sericytochromatia bacterium]|nr:glycosyltransferase [Candidatus Sericytochromatia bacterium]
MTAAPGRPAVLHAVRAYLPVTENWIHEQLRQLQGYSPVVVCDVPERPEAFPVAALHVLEPAPAWRTWVNRLHRRLWHANWPGTYEAVLQACRPALVHAHFGDRGVLMLATAMRHGLPLVTTFYGYDVSKLPREPKWRPRLARLFASGDRFLVEGPHMRDALVTLGCPPEKVFVHHLGLDPTRYPYRVRRPGPGPVRLLVAGSFREKKGLAYALEAFGRVAARRPGQVALTVIGDGPLREALVGIPRAHGVEPWVRWLGYQPHAVFLAEALAAHVLLAPSVVASDGDTEGGAPVTLLEAQATGLPVLATWHADVPEVTRPGASAWLVPERSVEALEERLEWLLANPGAWAEMGRAGRAHVEAAFDSRRLGRALETHYDEVLAARARPQPKGRSYPSKS